jgi:hypothetical protein
MAAFFEVQRLLSVSKMVPPSQPSQEKELGIESE